MNTSTHKTLYLRVCRPLFDSATEFGNDFSKSLFSANTKTDELAFFFPLCKLALVLELFVDSPWL